MRDDNRLKHIAPPQSAPVQKRPALSATDAREQPVAHFVVESFGGKARPDLGPFADDDAE